MPPKKVTLRYYAALPVEEAPEYRDGYHCDYCHAYFASGPLYHCPATGTDGCVQCVESKGQRSAARPPASSAGTAAAAPPAERRLPCAVGLMALPTRELFEESSAALRSIADNFGAAAASMTNGLFLAATERARLVLGYMLQTNVMGALLSSGASLLVVLDGAGGMGPACLAVPGNDAVAACLAGGAAGPSAQASVSMAPAYNTIVPVLTEQLETLFPWVGRLRTCLASAPLRPLSALHRPMEPFVAAPGAWPPFLQLCSATSASPSGTPDGSYFGAVTSEGLLQVLSFVGLHEWQRPYMAPGPERLWGSDGEVPSGGRATQGACVEASKQWAAEWLLAATADARHA